MREQLTPGYGLCECGCGEQTTVAKWTDNAKGHVGGQPIRFVVGHNRRKSPHEYLIDPETGCWLWQRAINSSGYGNIRIDGGTFQAHRVVYERHLGPIPEGLELDHLCRVRACVNPEHLEPVTARTNTLRSESLQAQNARKTHCDHGHPLEGDNLMLRPGSNGVQWRQCRECHRRSGEATRRRRRLEVHTA